VSVLAQQNGVPPPDAPKAGATPAAARVQELMTLLEARTPEAQDKVRQSLNDENWYVRGTAARALAEIRRQVILQALFAVASGFQTGTCANPRLPHSAR